jgi:hypothetical protein
MAVSVMKCKTCGKNSDSEFCFIHKPKKILRSTGRSLTGKKPLKPKNKLLAYRPKGYEEVYKEVLEMRQFFVSIWNKRPHKSEVSEEYLGSEPMSTYFHHILPKEKYPEACLDEENIVLLSLLEHSNVENDMYKYEEINDRRKHLLKKYERS